MTEGRGSEGREVKYPHWKVPQNQLSQTLFLLSRNTSDSFAWEARVLHSLMILLSRKEGPCGHAQIGAMKGKSCQLQLHSRDEIVVPALVSVSSHQNPVKW